ncbi:MAG: AAA family ATPase [Phascolarctobacterium sp.]|nr:AAA family ATPase [Phascolarctobacterium sp.]
MAKKRLPVGIESFAEIRKNNFYYVDKTALIEELLSHSGKVNLFTRPRRFGKSLNMSMLKSFFEIGCDKTLFAGLAIAQNKEICEQYMGKFPVIALSLKGVNASSFEEAKQMLIKVINREARRFQYLLDSAILTKYDKALLEKLIASDIDEGTIAFSLCELSELLHKHFAQKVIVLIDEYDVPLAKAWENGYYDAMTLLLRNLFENVLKTNEDLYFAVLTGCMRVAKESIFTGLNNFKVYSLTNVAFDEYFGFTDAEVRTMLDYYELADKYELVKAWYDGYRFGEVDVYCPWDVLCYCDDCRTNMQMEPQNYWVHTSGNELLLRFINSLGQKRQVTRLELEQLLNGDSVQKELTQELTYKEMFANADNIWSSLFMTGYLTQRGEAFGNRVNLVIPNLEIRNIITSHLLKLFQTEIVAKDGTRLNSFCEALLQGQQDEVEHLLTEYLRETISVRDTFVRKPTKENFYHGILLGVLAYKDGWSVRSNKETGAGFSDILVRVDNTDVGIVIEIKYAEENMLEAACAKALEQIEAQGYADSFADEGVSKILKYGIACNRKMCKVRVK